MFNVLKTNTNLPTYFKRLSYKDGEKWFLLLKAEREFRNTYYMIKSQTYLFVRNTTTGNAAELWLRHDG